MTSLIAAELHIPPSESMQWPWDELVDRFNDAVMLKREEAKFQARLAGAKFR